MEDWVEIEEFPDYKISNHGRVLNVNTGRFLRPSLNRGGSLKINFFVDGHTFTRSVATLVAEAFVQGRTGIFDTPIHLDGDLTNNRFENLMWRPRWFAWKFTRQFREESVHKMRGPIVDLDTGFVYRTFMDAVYMNGILLDDIWKSIIHKRRIFPTNQIFQFLK